jgi:hypothetical protein
VLTSGLPAASCGAAGRACVITADTRVIPETGALALLGAGLLLGGRWRSRAGGRPSA